jgi:hypothetical protein
VRLISVLFYIVLVTPPLWIISSIYSLVGPFPSSLSHSTIYAYLIPLSTLFKIKHNVRTRSHKSHGPKRQAPAQPVRPSRHLRNRTRPARESREGLFRFSTCPESRASLPSQTPSTVRKEGSPGREGAYEECGIEL